MKLLFTGASGFIGLHNLSELKNKYEVKTMGLGQNDDYVVNLSTTVPYLDDKFDIILHAAGKAHVIPKTISDENSFFQVNVEGTKNLCKALEISGIPTSFIFLSTVAVYGLESGVGITEDTPLNGKTPYALSKILAEEFLTDWCCKNNVKLSILRPSLIAGPNPPGNLGAMINGIKKNRYLGIGSGEARKSILMVNDIVRLVPDVIDNPGVYNVCDSYHPSFKELECLISKQLNKKKPISIPFIVAIVLAKFGDIVGDKFPFNSIKLNKIMKSLTFSNAKAVSVLNWEPINVILNFRINA